MAKNVRVTFKGTVPGVGQTTAGIAINKKTLVAGRIGVTSYTASGESLLPEDLGLETVDVLTLDVESVNNAATVPASGAIPLAAWDRSSNLLIVNIDHGADTAVTTGQACVVRFVAVGDSSLAPELT